MTGTNGSATVVVACNPMFRRREFMLYLWSTKGMEFGTFITSFVGGGKFFVI